MVESFHQMVLQPTATTSPHLFTKECLRLRTVDGSRNAHLSSRLSASLRSSTEECLRLRTVDGSRNSHLISQGSSTLSRIWDLPSWEKHQRISRYWRHVWKLPASATARMIAPVCSFFALWALVYHVLQTSFFPSFHIPLSILSLLTPPMALLLTLRTNQSLGRLQEARQAWGMMVCRSRIVANLMATYMDPAAAERAGRHLSLLGWSLKAKLRGESEDDVIGAQLSPGDASVVKAQRKRHIGLLRQVAKVVAGEAKEGRLDAVAHRAILEQLAGFHASVGVSERLLGSPVPPTYTRHTSRVLITWLAFVPTALRGAGLSLPLNLAGTVIATYVLVGIDEIGVELEQPFQLLPLNGLARAIMMDVVDEIEPVGGSS